MFVSNAQLGAMSKKLRAEFKEKGLGNQSIGAFAVSLESATDAQKEQYDAGVSGLEAIIADTAMNVATESAKEGNTITDAQVQAAKSIAKYATNPSAYFSAVTKLSSTPSDSQAVAVSLEDMNIEMLTSDEVSASFESYDPQAADNSLYASLVINFASARQDEFGEAFFPTITIDPMQSGIVVETEISSLVNEVTRAQDGSTIRQKLNKTPLVKAVYDESIFYNDRNKCVPVYRPKADAVFLKDYQYQDTSSGSSVTTAPLAVGVEVDLLGLSFTDEMLARGVGDNTDALDRTLNIDTVYVEIVGKDANDAVVTEVFPFSIKNMPRNNFIPNPQAHNKSLMLNFSTSSIAVLGTVATTAASAPSAIFGNSAVSNYTYYFNMALHGDAQTADGTVKVLGSEFSLAGIANSLGQKLATTSPDYTAAAGKITSMRILGYVPEAYRTNTNMRTLGQLATRDKYKLWYQVPFRSGSSILLPVSNAMGTDGDASQLGGLVTMTGAKMSMFAVKTLQEYEASLALATADGNITNIELKGIASYHINPYYSVETIDLATLVDSVASNTRLDDIRAAITNKIKDKSIVMARESNYFVAYEILNGAVSNKIQLIIGTDVQTKEYLCGTNDEFEIGSKFKAKVVATNNPLVKGKIYLTFGVFDETRNTKPNPLSFGNCAWSPTLSVEIQRSYNGQVSRMLNNIPRFLHFVNMPILARFDINDFNGVIGKVNRNVSVTNAAEFK